MRFTLDTLCWLVSTVSRPSTKGPTSIRKKFSSTCSPSLTRVPLKCSLWKTPARARRAQKSPESSPMRILILTRSPLSLHQLVKAKKKSLRLSSTISRSTTRKFKGIFLPQLSLLQLFVLQLFLLLPFPLLGFQRHLVAGHRGFDIPDVSTNLCFLRICEISGFSVY